MDITGTEKSKTGEKIALFEENALPHMDSLYRTALRLTHNEKDAEDLVQETFLRAFKSFHQFQLGTNCKAWLFKIMTNLHINDYQKRSKRPTKMSFDEIEDFYLYNKISDQAASSSVKDVEEQVLEGLLDSEVKEAIESLPYEFRITVILADIEGFRYKEIADILNCPIGTVRSRLSRGRRILEKHLWDYAKNSSFFREKCMTSCSTAVDNLVDYVHNELEEDNDGMIKEHLQQCKLCCDRFEFEERLTKIIHDKSRLEQCPEEVKKKIIARLKAFL